MVEYASVGLLVACLDASFTVRKYTETDLYRSGKQSSRIAEGRK